MTAILLLLASLSTFANPLSVRPLELETPWNLLPKFCQEKLLGSSDTLRGRAWLKQLKRSGDARLNAVVSDANFWPHWRVLTLFEVITWGSNPDHESSREKLGGFTHSRLGPMFLSGSDDTGGKTSLWVDFIHANAAESRSFYERLKLMVDEAVKAEFPGRAPARVHDFDPRTHSILLLLSDDFDSSEKTSLETLDAIADFNYRLVRRILDENFQRSIPSNTDTSNVTETNAATAASTHSR